MSLDEVATATKIGARMLGAIEDERFDQLPGGIFNKGFVKAYARHLGLDEGQAVADYLAATNAVQPIKEPEAVLSALAVRADEIRAVERPGDSHGLPWDRIAAVLLLVAFGIVLWGWRIHRQKRTERQSGEKKVQLSALPTTVPMASATATPITTSQQSPPNPAAPNPIPAAATSPVPVQLASPVAAGSFTLLIQAQDDSWLTLTVDGKDIMNGLLLAGAQKSIEARHEVVVRAGNIGGLGFTLNGKKLPAQGPTDEVKTIKFDASGVQVPVETNHLPGKPA